MILSRAWAMPAKDTFAVPPIGEFVQRYLRQSTVSVDPFARNCRWATYTNDLDPETKADFHMEARAFVADLGEQGVVADLVLCDPPYSQVQVSRAYRGVGRDYRPFGDDNNAMLYREIRDGLDRLLCPGGMALSFGWNSAGFGKARGYTLLEVVLVCHGGGT